MLRADWAVNCMLYILMKVSPMPCTRHACAYVIDTKLASTGHNVTKIVVKRHANPLGKLPAAISQWLTTIAICRWAVLYQERINTTQTEDTHKVMMIGGKCSLLQSLSVLHMHLHVYKYMYKSWYRMHTTCTLWVGYTGRHTHVQCI
jgi:hypothetical protein